MQQPTLVNKGRESTSACKSRIEYLIGCIERSLTAEWVKPFLPRSEPPFAVVRISYDAGHSTLRITVNAKQYRLEYWREDQADSRHILLVLVGASGEEAKIAITYDASYFKENFYAFFQKLLSEQLNRSKEMNKNITAPQTRLDYLFYLITSSKDFHSKVTPMGRTIKKAIGCDQETGTLHFLYGDVIYKLSQWECLGNKSSIRMYWESRTASSFDVEFTYDSSIFKQDFLEFLTFVKAELNKPTQPSSDTFSTPHHTPQCTAPAFFNQCFDQFSTPPQGAMGFAAPRNPSPRSFSPSVIYPANAWGSPMSTRSALAQPKVLVELIELKYNLSQLRQLSKALIPVLSTELKLSEDDAFGVATSLLQTAVNLYPLFQEALAQWGVQEILSFCDDLDKAHAGSIGPLFALQEVNLFISHLAKRVMNDADPESRNLPWPKWLHRYMLYVEQTTCLMVPPAGPIQR